MPRSTGSTTSGRAPPSATGSTTARGSRSPCAAPAGPVARRTSVGPVVSQLVVRAARADGTGVPSPVFLGLDARDHRAANVVHALTFPGGTIAEPSGSRLGRLPPARSARRRAGPPRAVRAVVDPLGDHQRRPSARPRSPRDRHRGGAASDPGGRARGDVRVRGRRLELPSTRGRTSLHRYLAGRFDAVVDFRARWGRPADAIAAGLLAPDGIHPTARRGSGDLASALAGMLATDAEP